MSGTKIKPFTDGADAEVCLAQKLYCTVYSVHHRICAIHNWLGVCAGIPIIIDTVYIEDSRKSRH